MIIGTDSDQALAIVYFVDSFRFTNGGIIHQNELWGFDNPIEFTTNWQGNITATQNKTGLNPGTIKRHLDDLLEKKLVFHSQTIKNEYGFTLK